MDRRKDRNLVTDKQLEREKLLAKGIQFVDHFINRDYLIGLNLLPVIKTSYACENYTGLRMFRLKRIVFEEQDDIRSLLVSVYGALHSLKATALMIINGKPDSVEFYVGVSSDNDAAVSGIALNKSIQGNFNGSEIESYSGDVIRSKMKEYVYGNTTLRSIASVAIVPTGREDDENSVQGIEKFINTMMGETYTALFISEPLDQTDIRTRKRGFEELYSTLSPFKRTSLSYGTNTSEAVTTGSFSSFANSVNNSVSNTNSEGSSHSTTSSQGTSSNSSFGSSYGYGGEAGSFGTNSGGSYGYNSSTGESMGTSTSWARAVSSGSAQTEATGENRSDSKTSGDSRTLSIEYENKTVDDLLERLSAQIERIDANEVYGWWQSGVYFLSEDIQTVVVAANAYRALVAGDESQVENAYINVWDAQDHKDSVNRIGEYLRCGKHPVFGMMAQGEFAAQKVKAVQMISGQEMPVFAGFPTSSVPGIGVDRMAAFGQEINFVSGSKSAQDFPIGRIMHKGICTDRRVNLDLEAFRSHCFVTGSTGSGKSNTVYRLLDNFIERGVKFLIIEPAKGEYKYEYGGLDKINIFWTNPTVYPMLHINPFSFPEGIHILEHLDRLIEIFDACWPLYAAMPAILKSAVERSYIQKGWDLVRSIQLGTNGQRVFPTFEDLLSALPDIINESSYSSKSKGDYIGALVTRVESLTKGIMGRVFCSTVEIDDSVLFDEKTIVDLSRVGSAETKSLLMGVLIMKLSEHRVANATQENVSLKHVTVLEEAHNLLRNTQGSGDNGLMGKSVEMISNSIAEMRTYGEGFIIVDQSPTAVDISAIKNTNTKIVMRLPEKNDQDVAGHSFSLTPEQVREISRLGVGMAVVGQNGWLEPVLTRIDRSSGRYYQRDTKIPSDGARKEMLGRLVIQLIDQYNDGTYLRAVLRRIITQSELLERKKQEYLRMLGSFLEKERNADHLAQFIVEILECEGMFSLLPIKLSDAVEWTEDDKNEFMRWRAKWRKSISCYITFAEPSKAARTNLLRILIWYMANIKKDRNYRKLERYKMWKAIYS